MAPEINSKKRVLFIITQSEFGGAQRFLLTFLSRLETATLELLVAVGEQGNGDFTKQLKKNGIPVHELKFLRRRMAPAKDLRSVFEIRELIKKFRPDTVFLNSSKAGFVGSLATVFPSRIPNLKVIYRIGGWTFNDPWPWWQKQLWLQLEKKSASWKDIIIVNNDHDLKQAEKLKIKPRQATVMIHNGIDTYKMDYLPREEARLRLFEKIAKHSGKIFQTKNIVGTIANFYPSKGLEYLIMAADRLKDEDIVFCIIGDGIERPKLEKLINDRGLNKKVFLLGHIPDAYRFITAFDVFVLASVKEGFPWSLIEAMAAKTPVIATRVGAVPEIIDNGENGFMVASRDPRDIAEKIKSILGSDHLRKELGIQAHQTVLFKFDLDKMVNQTEAFL